jgi:hypothetical protein
VALEQTTAVRTTNLPLAALVAGCLTAGCLLAGCGGSSSPQSTAPANTRVNPGPNPTTGDPGPNNTSQGPLTLQGTLAARSGCVELDGNAAGQPAARFQLDFTTESVRRQGKNLVLSGPDGDRTVGPRDVVYVAGHPGSGSGPCGRIFSVEKVVAVTPPA